MSTERAENNNLNDAGAEQEIAGTTTTKETVQETVQETSQDPSTKKLKRNNLKDKFKEKGEEEAKATKPPMSKEETIAFYNENLPFMKLQDEYEELLYRFHERKVKNLEMQVREIEAIGYLGQWKAGQDDAKRRQEHEAKMKEEWEKMSPEEQAEWTRKAKDNLKHMEQQAKTGAGMGIVYDGSNAGAIQCFVQGVPFDNRVITPQTEDKMISFQIPDLSKPGDFTEISMVPGQLIERLESGEFIVSFQ